MVIRVVTDTDTDTEIDTDTDIDTGTDTDIGIDIDTNSLIGYGTVYNCFQLIHHQIHHLLLVGNYI